MIEIPCQICSAKTLEIGKKRGEFRKRDYHLQQCQECGFAWVKDPDLDFENIYNENYYKGQGADPLVDYLSEMNSPESSIRQFEWKGILEVIEGLTHLNQSTT